VNSRRGLQKTNTFPSQQRLRNRKKEKEGGRRERKRGFAD